MQIHFLRHATFVLTINGHTILVDPMLSPARTMEPIANAGNDWRIPMVDLPLSEADLLRLSQEIEAVLVTHIHRDHWDAYAQELLPKNLPILCQPEDQASIEQAGFSQVQPVTEQLVWQGLQISRTGGQHGYGDLGKKMGPVSGFVLKAGGSRSLYIAGDSVWCPEVERALAQFTPAVVVLNTGAATYATGGGPITMNDEDVCRVCRAMPEAQVIAVHMETVNHCRLSRVALRTRVEAEGLAQQVRIPDDGEVLTF
ncbi:MAG: MBL fold metallo-hydrolase [Ktedonobacteraceae bacterium]|nr:MBL fold metallo-hydrolase [Ktedonobacteraceae bacterium]